MNCQQFLEWLDSGERTVSPASDSEPFLAHSNQCPDCRKALDSYERLLRVLSGIEPSSQSLDRIQKGIQQKIADRPVENRSPAGAEPSSWWLFRTPAFAMALTMLFALGALIWLNKKPGGEIVQPRSGKPVSIAALIGSAKIVRKGQPIEVPHQVVGFSLFSEDHLTIDSEKPVSVQFPDGRRLSVVGAAECVLTESLNVEKGEGTFTFEKCGNYLVRMNRVELTILGTVLHLKAEKGEDKVWVQEGKIAWTIPATGQKGEIQAGSGLSVSNGKTAPLAASPLGAVKPPVSATPLTPPNTAPVEPVIPGKGSDE